LVVGVVVGVVRFREGVELLFYFCLGAGWGEAEDVVGAGMRGMVGTTGVEEAVMWTGGVVVIVLMLVGVSMVWFGRFGG
jgi:hypothetical protein